MSDLEILVAIGMLAGLAGVLIPILPGLPLIGIAAILWALLGDVGGLGWVAVAVIVTIGVAGMVVAATLPARRTLEGGVPPWVLVVAGIGVVIGFFAIPVIGALVGGPVALFLTELLRMRDAGAAWRSTREALVAMGVGIGIQLVTGVAMIAVWLVGVALT